jgi:hypothetical protein
VSAAERGILLSAGRQPEQNFASWKRVLVASLAGGLLLCALAGEAVSAERSLRVGRSDSPSRADPMQQIGVTETAAWVSDGLEARYIVDLAKSIGFNAFKIIVPWTKGQAEILNDQAKTCNVAKAAQADGMAFYLDIAPQRRDGRPGDMPVGDGDIRRYATTAVAYLSALAGPSGCIPGTKITVEVGNEPNNDAFWALRNPAFAYTKLLAYTYAALKSSARALGVEVTVTGGELTFTRDPLGFIRKMGYATRRLRIHQPIMDEFAVHPYDNGTITITEHDNMLIPAVDRFLGQVIVGPPTVVDTEYGASPPHDAQEASAYAYAINAAACQGIHTFVTFKLFDDPPTVPYGWRSGLFQALPGNGWPPSPDWSPVAKTLVAQTLKTSIADALNGNLACPPHRN